ncbi:MAG: SDR family oxidoreductase [Phycisphaeraceae bacterium]|nr:SDR family oxidoreductase [Phycisphaeraceae bacterium]
MPAQTLTALITGGTRRVGLAIARALVGCAAADRSSNEKPNTTLILTSRDPDSTEAQNARGVLKALGARVELERFDPGDSESVASLAQRLKEKHASLDALVLNASSYAPTPLRQLTSDNLSDFMTINAFSPVLLVEELLTLLEKSTLPGGAGIVAMVDMHVLGRPRKDLLAYSMSKAALLEAVRSLARELAPKIRINAVAPGVVAWPEAGKESGEAFRREYLSRVPLQRAGTPEDAAETVRWLALDARYVTGEVVRVDGGRWLA